MIWRQALLQQEFVKLFLALGMPFAFVFGAEVWRHLLAVGDKPGVDRFVKNPLRIRGVIGNDLRLAPSTQTTVE